MGLTCGARLSPYGVFSPLGTGGMGEVCRARDMKLNRDVVIVPATDSAPHSVPIILNWPSSLVGT